MDYKADRRKLRYRFWSWVYWLHAIYLGLKHAHKIHLGSHVVYQGKVCWVNNGVRVGHWTLLDDERRTFDAPCRECRRVRGIKEWQHAFNATYSWWMGNWHRIHVEKRFYGWEW